MARSQADIFIAGGGIAGLTGALALARAGFTVVLATPTAPITAASADGSDLRSTAFLKPAQRLFDEIGLWPALAADAVPLDILRIVDSAGAPADIRDTRDFRASDLGEDSFGWNLLNWRVTAGLMDTLAQEPRVDLRIGAAFSGMTTRNTGVIVRLSTGDSIAARLVVACDGRASAVREAAGIPVETTRYGQNALAFVVTHPIPHGNASTEIYHEGGPFTLVPLPDLEGQPASAVVWMTPATETRQLAALDAETFSTTASARSCHWLGPLTLRSPRRLWPIISQRATRLTAERTAILAEAAHVVPPIGAQGLNTSLNDLIALRDLAAADPAQLGSRQMLDAFARRRATDIRARVATIDLFNRVTRSGDPTLQSLRLAGLRAVHGVKPLRRAVMRAGMGPA